MSEYDAIDRYVAKLAREEEGDINREQGEFLLDVLSSKRQREGNDALFEILNQAWQAKAEESEQ